MDFLTMAHVHAFFTILYVTSFSNCAKDVAFEILTFEVPELAVSGMSYELVCIHNLETSRLYSLQWFKDDHEFFRFEPKTTQKVQYFPLPDIDLKMNKVLNGSHLVLEHIRQQATGSYKCDVTEDQTFLTVSKQTAMTVVKNQSENGLPIHRAQSWSILTAILIIVLTI